VNAVWVDHVPQALVVVGDRIWLGGVEAVLVGSVKRLAKFPVDFEMQEEGTDIPSAKVDEDWRSLLREISAAETDVLLWLARGLESDDDLAHALHRSPHTIRNELKGIFRKLGVHSKSQVLALINRKDPARSGR
jgi:DNA-binding CsgD family transcriptional regulator